MSRKPPRHTPSSVRASSKPHEEVRSEFSRLARSASLHVAGLARSRPQSLLRRYAPVAKIDFCDTQYFLASPRQIPELRFLVAYVVQEKLQKIFARIFYKDLSLVWRVASHLIDCDGEFWIGKGIVVSELRGGFEYLASDESSTDLPFEIQTALERVNARTREVPRDDRVLGLVLRNAPSGRMQPYADFSKPRARAAADPSRRINGGKPVAWFSRPGDPGSLCFARGFDPDFRGGVVERSKSKSSMYHGAVRRFRILSKNQQVQYFFFAGKRHIWLAPPQTLETELGTYGARLVRPAADDDLFVPGYEYHHVDPDVDADQHFSQIPNGFAGEPSEVSPDRADASAWLDALPVVKAFRRSLLTD